MHGPIGSGPSKAGLRSPAMPCGLGCVQVAVHGAVHWLFKRDIGRAPVKGIRIYMYMYIYGYMYMYSSLYIDIEVDVDIDSYFWLFKGGFKVSFGTV